MKIDLHVHSKYSMRPSEWILKKLGCPESFTDPVNLYNIAKKRGMSRVTITDHNTIEGCMEIAHFPDAFISEEVTTYFPDNGCKLHVLVYNIDEKIHEDIQKIRESVFDLTAYLRKKRIVHALAHPLFSVNRKLTMDHFEKCILLFKNFELNGARSEEQNRCLQLVLAALTPEKIDELSEKHNISPDFSFPWIKNLIGGSDDHSSLTIAHRYTQVNEAATTEDFLKEVLEGRAEVSGASSTPKTLARNLYSIAYQFYENKFDLKRYTNNDVIFKFLDRFLRVDQNRSTGLLARINFYWNHKKAHRSVKPNSTVVMDLLREETHRLIWDDPQLTEIFNNGNGTETKLDQKWFHFVNRVSNKTLLHFTDHVMESLVGANLFNLFNYIGSVGALYSLLAPYFVAFSIYSEDRHFSSKVLRGFIQREPYAGKYEDIGVAQFTDTFYEINGVSNTLRKQIELALRTGKKYCVITCSPYEYEPEPGLINFRPIATYEVPVYPEQKLFCPPLLEILDYCYEHGFTHIHSATPGPLGFTALAAARTLKLPIVGTYHTALPQYAEYLTEDASIAEIVWKYVIWYYDQMDIVYVPSKYTALELEKKGISPSKICVFPRGVDTSKFHPAKRNGCLNGVCSGSNQLKLLYVGRISKEKNLEILVNVFKSLAQSRLDIFLVVVGDAPYRVEMQNALRGLPVFFTGYLEGESLASVYASCDLFVFPSTTDTFGNVVLEAQASGLPVIVTDCGGPQENMVPGQTGLVVAGNDEKSLLEGIKTLLFDPSRLKEMSNAARKYTEVRTFEKAFCETWELYNDIIKGAGVNR